MRPWTTRARRRKSLLPPEANVLIVGHSTVGKTALGDTLHRLARKVGSPVSRPYLARISPERWARHRRHARAHRRRAARLMLAPLPHPCRSPRQSSVTAIGRRQDAMKRGGDARLSTVGSKLGATDAPSPPTAPLAAPPAAPLRDGERCLQLEQAAGSDPVQQNGHDAVPNAAEAGAQAGARVHRRERFAGHEPGPYVDDGRSFVAPVLSLASD